MNNSTVTEQQRGENPTWLLGAFRRFGCGGPVHEVVAVRDERTAAIRVVELEYPIDKVLDDDEA